MVSKAREDLPEPDRPVNTTSLSRGTSTSMFFRLCSRAPRMVIARKEFAPCWRRALRISSITTFPDRARQRASSKARLAGNGDRAPIWERRKNASAMLVLASSHQPFPDQMAAAGNRADDFSSNPHPASQFLSEPHPFGKSVRKQKGRREAGLSKRI